MLATRESIDSMTLDYELEASDLEAFFAHHAKNAPYLVSRNRRMRWIWAGLFALLAIVIYETRSRAEGVSLGILAAIYLLFYGRLNRWWYVRHNRRLNSGPDGPRLGPVKLELEGGKLVITAPEASSQIELSAIRRIDESDAHYFIYLGPASAGIVPKRSRGAQEFVRELRSATA